MNILGGSEGLVSRQSELQLGGGEHDTNYQRDLVCRVRSIADSDLGGVRDSERIEAPDNVLIHLLHLQAPRGVALCQGQRCSARLPSFPRNTVGFDTLRFGTVRAVSCGGCGENTGRGYVR